MLNSILVVTLVLLATITWAQTAGPGGLPEVPTNLPAPSAAFALPRQQPASHLPHTWPTILNVSLRAGDAAGTCILMHQHPGQVHENWQAFDSCRGVALTNATFALGSWLIDWQLRRHHHQRLARWPQLISAAGSGAGLATYPAAIHRIRLLK